MWMPKNSTERREGSSGLVAVAIDKDKGSQNALKWAVDWPDRLNQVADAYRESTFVCKDPDSQTKDMFLRFRCFCTRKDIQCKDIVLEDIDVAKGLIEYVSQTAIEALVVGASSKTGFLRRFKTADIPGSVSKGAPDFCSVYVISKGKISSMRSASRPAPTISPLRNQLLSTKPPPPLETTPLQATSTTAQDVSLSFPLHFFLFCSGRASIDRIFPEFYDNMETVQTARLSNISDIESNHSFESMHYRRKSLDANSLTEFSSISQENERSSSVSQAMDDVEAEMRRLKLELKQTMEMYSTACKEAPTAKQKARELHRWKLEEERRLEEALLAEEAALAIAEKEKAKSKAAIEAAEAAQRIAELEAQKRINAEMKALKEAEDKRRAFDALTQSDVRYRKYTIQEIEAATEFFTESRKIGEGGYGPVYKCYLDHTRVAMKVLRPDAAQGRSQFQQEV
ncbi:U-box domain-containing protein 52-like [Tripterygium wilfordii]|uniref:RING-type E3 ubiquitin transferase n=1 Tax=Tripterygium wilfordii TaxID=458696 RepID=A0A7J7DP30_TRIWF|nr:U-box domain-containing protein 52-like [Tripterygium wilfordii]